MCLGKNTLQLSQFKREEMLYNGFLTEIYKICSLIKYSEVL